VDKEELLRFLSDDCIEFADNILEMVNAPYFTANGMRPVSISRGKVVIEMTCGPGHRNSNGFIHGGAIYGGMDHAYAILVNIVGHAVGQSSNINYYRPARADVLRMEATIENESKSLCYCHVKAFEGEKLLASGIFTSFKLNEICK